VKLWDDALDTGVLTSLAAWGAIVAATLDLASAASKTGRLLAVHASLDLCGRQEFFELGVQPAG
jgi:hypothetical protein